MSPAGSQARQQLTRDDIGGWLFKCNPREWDIEAALQDGQRIESWRVHDSYRLSLIRSGYPAVIWVTGSAGSRPQPGIWVVGYTTGELYESQGDHYWINKERGQQPGLSAGLLTWPIKVLPRSQLLDHPACSTLEILRQPQMSNPSYLTPGQQEAIAGMVEKWPTFD